MKRILSFIVPAALVAAGIVGCSGDQTAPSGSTAVRWASDKTIGPSEIVLAIDVSDAVDADQLAALVAAAGSALGNPALVPPDGSVSVGAVVYGDTTAIALAGLVPVTAEHLVGDIQPALQGLVDDRLVTGGTADLAGALARAGQLLAAGQTMDRQVLVLGAGAAADTAGVAAVCADLAAAGVMVSAVALDEGAPLASCAAATGGFFAGMVDDASAAAASALAYMLQADLDLTGSAAGLARGADFTATALLYRGGDPGAYPLVGHDVTFAVVAGPNLGDPVTAATDTAGRALFTYAGDGGPGMDTVVATALHPGTGTTLSDTVTVTWQNTPPVCDAGGPYAAAVEGDTVRIRLDATGTTDAEGDSVTFAWASPCDGVTFDDPSSATPWLTIAGDCLCVDTLTVALEVGDGYAASVCEASVALEDHRPPVIETIDHPLVLWPPNHKYADYTPDMFVTGAVTACGEPLDLADVQVMEVRSDEPDDATGDGRTCNDIVVDCPDLVKLRAERMGGGDGRVYTIVYRLTDANGNSTEFGGTVVVPHDEAHLQAGTDAGGFTVTPDCGPGRRP